VFELSTGGNSTKSVAAHGDLPRLAASGNHRQRPFIVTNKNGKFSLQFQNEPPYVNIGNFSRYLGLTFSMDASNKSRSRQESRHRARSFINVFSELSSTISVEGIRHRSGPAAGAPMCPRGENQSIQNRSMNTQSSRFDGVIEARSDDGVRQKAKPNKHIVLPQRITCAYCGKVFNALCHNARLCSYECRRKHKMSKRAMANAGADRLEGLRKLLAIGCFEGSHKL
jgi:hypothetical protein